MSVQNTRQQKQVRRLRRALRKGRLPVFFNLVQYLTDRHPISRREARQWLVDGKVRVDSHPIGRRAVGEDVYVAAPDVPVAFRERIVVNG
jgi:hypothetical protein